MKEGEEEEFVIPINYKAANLEPSDEEDKDSEDACCSKRATGGVDGGVEVNVGLEEISTESECPISPMSLSLTKHRLLSFPSPPFSTRN